MRASKFVKRGNRELTIDLESIVPCVSHKPYDLAALYIHSDNGACMKIQMTKDEFKQLAENMLDLFK